MIYPKELRIGNYLNHSELGIVEVIAFGKDYIHCLKNGETHYESIGRFSNIPITEDMLLKNGFILCEGKYGEYFKHKEYDGLRLWFFENEHTSCWFVGAKDYETNDTQITRGNLKYIHILQNLIYFQIDEELEINL